MHDETESHRHSFPPSRLPVTHPSSTVSIGTMSVRVVARIRPLLEKEIDKDIIVRADRVEEGKPLTTVKIPSPKNEAEEFSFAFNGVYDQFTTQEELFTAEGKPNRRDTLWTATEKPKY